MHGRDHAERGGNRGINTIGARYFPNLEFTVRREPGSSGQPGYGDFYHECRIRPRAIMPAWKAFRPTRVFTTASDSILLAVH